MATRGTTLEERPDSMAEEKALLIRLLKDEDRLYQRLAVLTDEEHKAIISGDVDSLSQLLSGKERIIGQLDGLENRRLATVVRLATKLQESEENFTIGRLAEIVEEPDLSRLTAIQESLQQSIERLTESNRQNAVLLQSSLTLLNRWINFIIACATEAALLYSKEGQPAQGVTGNRLLNKKA